MHNSRIVRLALLDVLPFEDDVVDCLARVRVKNRWFTHVQILRTAEVVLDVKQAEELKECVFLIKKSKWAFLRAGFLFGQYYMTRIEGYIKNKGESLNSMEIQLDVKHPDLK